MPCGLSSETACGLSEALHPWPRPDVHERLDRAIEKLDFDVAIVCYGINDGIYAPFSEERFATYQAGMTTLFEKLKASGAKVIALTPAPFDAASFPQDKLLPEGAEEYGYTKVYRDYNEVMKRYAAWVMEQVGTGQIDASIEITEALTADYEALREIRGSPLATASTPTTSAIPSSPNFSSIASSAWTPTSPRSPKRKPNSPSSAITCSPPPIGSTSATNAPAARRTRCPSTRRSRRRPGSSGRFASSPRRR